jgi:uncharacterized protein (TIGR02268 family)
VDPGDEGITLALAVPLEPTERLALRFTYREGFPSSVVLLLTGQPGEVDSVVSVSRPRQTVEACRAELASTRERCEAQSKELEELKARPSVVSPAAVALAGLVDADGLRFQDFSDASCDSFSGELRLAQCRSLGGRTWSVVAFEVSNLGEEPWTPAWAEVTPAAGREPRRARTVLSTQAPIPPGGTMSVAVEVEMPSRAEERWLRAPHTLRVCDAAGRRCLALPQVRL